ncbi:MAG: hypothetical protein JW747_08485 [Candidatus Aminicenantes bacterium]|nr:hypothetical protein [Candidatus Aminicenantes bacterium]
MLPLRKSPVYLLAALVVAVPLAPANENAGGLFPIAVRSFWGRGAALSPLPAASRPHAAISSPESPSSASGAAAGGLSSLQKSLLLPGWGQAAEKHYFEAALFFSAEFLCWAGFLDQNRKGNRSYDLYKAAASTADAIRYRQETETFDKRRNLFLLGAALVWAANLVDMHRIVSGKRKAGESRSLSLRLESGEGQKVSLALACRF